MDTVLITIHLIVVLFLIVLVLLQRSEGGGLGIGGNTGMATGRKAADGLTRTTGILAASFFVTSLGLGVLARYADDTGGAFDRAGEVQGVDAGSENGILDALGGDLPGVAPSSAEPAPAELPAEPAAETGTGVPTGQ